MRRIRTILCPVDFTLVSGREVELGTELARRFDAALVLQHNLAAGAGLGMTWMHAKERHATEEAAEENAHEQLRQMLDGLPGDVRLRARAAITYGALDHCVRSLADEVTADLIIVGTHGRAAPEHPSETQRLIASAPCPVLATRDDAPHRWLPRLDRGADEGRIPTLVPIDFSPHSTRALNYALDLAEELPLDLNVLHVPQRADHDVEWAEREIARTAPGRRASFKLEILQGDPAEAILQKASVLQARLIVLGAHARGWIERLLARTPAVSGDLLLESRCPLWFVPATAAL